MRSYIYRVVGFIGVVSFILLFQFIDGTVLGEYEGMAALYSLIFILLSLMILFTPQKKIGLLTDISLGVVILSFLVALIGFLNPPSSEGSVGSAVNATPMTALFYKTLVPLFIIIGIITFIVLLVGLIKKNTFKK